MSNVRPLVDHETLYQDALALEAAGEFRQAARLYQQLVTRSGDPRHFVAYGVCLQRLGYWEQSVQRLERGIELKPQYCEPDARLFLAEAYLRTNQKAKAVLQWQIVEGISPEYPSYEAPSKRAKAMLEAHANGPLRATGA